jgi:hypothetical protein
MKEKISKTIVIITCVLLIGIIFAFFDPRYGFLESNFRLADRSRLPKWFSIPHGYDRYDFKMTINLYSSVLPFTNNVVVTIYDQSPKNKVVMKKAGKEREHPYTTQQFKEKKSHDMCPTYLIITIDNIEEVFEQKCEGEGDILYITDNPKLREGLK